MGLSINSGGLGQVHVINNSERRSAMYNCVFEQTCTVFLQKFWKNFLFKWLFVALLKTGGDPKQILYMQKPPYETFPKKASSPECWRIQ